MSLSERLTNARGYQKAQGAMQWLLLLLWAAGWAWGAWASYSAAGFGALLLWVTLGSVACLFGFYWCFVLLVENLSGTLATIAVFSLLGVFMFAVMLLWDVRW